jgi:hypothetical protein
LQLAIENLISEISSQENPFLFGEPAGATTCVRLFCRADPGSIWRANQQERKLNEDTDNDDRDHIDRFHGQC